MKLIILVACIASVYALSAKEYPAITKELVDTVNAAGYWKAGYNAKWAHASLQDAMDIMGVLPAQPSAQETVDSVMPGLPDEFDSRAKWPMCKSIGTIRDQSVCGSCWAFGASEAWSDRVCIGTNGKFTELLSAQDILTCCGFTCGNGCKGGFLSGAWHYIHEHGLVTGGLYNATETCQPYSLAPCDHHSNGTLGPCGETVPTPACKKSCVNGANWDADKHKASKVYSVSKEAAIMTEIYNNGPVEGAFSVYNDFLAYKSGVYRHVTGSFLGGHAIKIVGWGVENGSKYWLIANSWNEGWGDRGYFRILRGSNECGIENEAHAGVI